MGFRREWYEDDCGRGGGGGFAFSGGFGQHSVTKILMITLFVVFGIQFIGFMIQGDDLIAHLLGLRPSNAIFMVPFVSYMFMHEVLSPLHILFNALVLFFFGRELEGALGPKRFLTVFFGAGILGGLAFIVDKAIAGTNITVIGASGGCLGIIVLYAFMYPQRNVIFILFPMKVWVLASILVGIDLMTTLIVKRTDAITSTATLAHLGGAAWGAIMYYWRVDMFSWADDAKAKIQANRDRRDREIQRSQDEEMDRILKKIHDEGLPSLTSHEKKFIDRVSREKRSRN